MGDHIRLATEADAAKMLAIYGPFVRESPITFEVVVPSEEEFGARVTATLQSLPWLVSDADGEICGFAYAARLSPREAYQWSVDCSVYVHADHRGRGVGRGLYTSLFACLRVQGYYNAYAGITLPNAASVALHEEMGFSQVGVYRSAGYKSGAWHDVGWWQLALREHGPVDSPPRSLGDVVDTSAWREALAEGERLLGLG
jgi:L-amino acid N-acyltransferase YncA